MNQENQDDPRIMKDELWRTRIDLSHYGLSEKTLVSITKENSILLCWVWEGVSPRQWYRFHNHIEIEILHAFINAFLADQTDKSISVPS